MIHCVKFTEVDAYLVRLRYLRMPSRSEYHALYMRGDEVVTLRLPNQRNLVPEMLVNEALEAAEIEPPRWDVEWCD